MKISNKYTIHNNPHIIQLNEDFAINNKIYNKYTLQPNGNLNFFMLEKNIINDYKHMPLNNLASDVNDYPINLMIVDSIDNDIFYILYKINDVYWVSKIQNIDSEYKELNSVQITKIGSANASNPKYYARPHMEFICQTIDYILVYDNFCIRKINKNNFTLQEYNLRTPVIVKSTYANFVDFYNCICNHQCTYNCDTNSLSTDWFSVDFPETSYSYNFIENDSIKFPITSSKNFLKSFKFYNYIQIDEYKEYSFSYAQNGNNRHTTYYALIPIILFNNCSYSNAKNIQIASGNGTMVLYASTNNTYITAGGSSTGSTTIGGHAYIHKIDNKIIYFYSNNHMYTLSTENDTGFDKIYVEEYKNNLLILYNINSYSYFLLLDSNLNEIINYNFENLFLICNKYNDDFICMISDTNEFCIYKIDIENNTLIKTYSEFQIKSFSIINNNIWLMNNNMFEIQTQGTPQELSITFENEFYEYIGADINSYIQIYAKNFLSEYLNINVKLTLSGPCIFENNSNILIANTGNSITTIPVIIRGADKCTCSIEEV